MTVCRVRGMTNSHRRPSRPQRRRGCRDAHRRRPRRRGLLPLRRVQRDAPGPRADTRGGVVPRPHREAPRRGGARGLHARLVAAHRAIPQDVAAALPTVARLASGEQPLQALRAAYELFALAKRYRPWLDLDADDARRPGTRDCGGVRSDRGRAAPARARRGADRTTRPTSATPRTTCTCSTAASRARNACARSRRT